MSTLTCVIPFVYPQQPVAETVEQVLAQTGVDAEALVLNLCDGTPPPMRRNVVVVRVASTNLAGLYNAGYEDSRHGGLCLLPPHVTLEPGALELLADALYTHPRAAFAYAPYWLNDQLHPVLEDIGDLTEQRDTGWVRLYRLRALRSVEGWDTELDHAADYDLHLRLSREWDSVAVGRPLYHVDPPADAPASVHVGRSTYALPAASEHSVFSYLHYDEAQQQETEAVFARWLRDRGAWLQPPQGGRYDATQEAERPLVSVVIPCRNRVRFVRQAVESVLTQTYDNFEVLLIDNGSTDDSPESVKELTDPRVRVVHNDDETIAAALNRGVREARGAYVAQLDSDDLYTPRTLAVAVEQLQANPGAGLAVSYYECIDEHGERIDSLGIVEHLEYSRNNILRCNGAGAVRVWRKGIIEELGGFDEGPLANYGEDYDLLLRLGEHYDVIRLHEVLYRYRRHTGNTDAVRDPLDNIRLKTLARHRALQRRTR